MPQAAYKIAIVTGEASGDLLAAALIDDLKRLKPDIEIIGVGGKKVEATGIKVIANNEAFSVMGLVEILADLPKIYKLKNKIVKNIIDFKPDVFIGIDAPDLNFSIAKKLKTHGIKVIHYVSPSVWAWRPGRVDKMGRFIDMVLTLFPFETETYQQKNIKAEFVGHPLANQIPIKIDKAKAKEALGLKKNQQVLAILPGSRNREIETMTAVFCQVILAHSELFENHVILSANVSDAKRKLTQSIADEQGLNIAFTDDASSLLKAADLALLSSGTVALEAMLCKTPMVVAYRISQLTWYIVKAFRMLKLPYYSLPNVLYGGFLVPEIMQKNVTVENLAHALKQLPENKNKALLIDKFEKIHHSITSSQSDIAAIKVLDFLSVEC